MDYDDPNYLLLNKNYKSIVCLNTKTKSTFTIPRYEGDDCDDFQSLPKSRVLILTENGMLILYHYNKDNGACGVVGKTQIEFIKERKEKSITLCVCPKGKVAAINTRVKGDHWISRVLVYEIDGSRIFLKSTVDLYDCKTKYFYAMNFHGYRRDLLILTGMTSESKSYLYTLVYFNGELTELSSKRKITQSNYPRKLQRIGTSLVGADNNGKLFKIGYN